MMRLLLAFPAKVRDKHRVTFIDNISVLYSSVKGASSAEDQRSLIHSLRLRLSHLRCHVWTEDVASRSDCSDGGSRAGTKYLIVKSWEFRCAESNGLYGREAFLASRSTSGESGAVVSLARCYLVNICDHI